MEHLQFSVFDENNVAHGIIVVPDASYLEEAMATEYPGYGFQIGHGNTIMISKNGAMTVEEIKALNEIDTVKILNEDWAIRHVGIHYSASENRIILIECAPIPGWFPGQPVPEVYENRWSNDPSSKYDAEHNFLIRFDREVVYVLGRWSDDIRQRIERSIHVYREGGIDTETREFKEFARTLAELQRDEYAEMESKQERLIQKISNLRSELVENYRDLKELRTILATLPEEEEHNDVEQIIDDIKSLSDVKSVEVNVDSLLIYTKPIHIKHDTNEFNLGEFEIDLNINGSDVWVRNISKAHPTLEHPNINGSCLIIEEHDITISKLYASLKLVELTRLVINYLKSYNEETAYAPIEEWDLIK